MRNTVLTTLALVGALALGACDSHDHDHPHGDDHGHEHGGDDHHGHVHFAPNGGHLIILGDTVAHLEVRLDEVSGKLTLNVLGSHAVAPVRTADASIAVEVTPEGGEAFTVETKPVANALTGETVGDSSQFEGRDDRLKGVEHFSGRIVSLNAVGATFSDIAFDYEPEGHDHDHEHGDGHDHDHEGE